MRFDHDCERHLGVQVPQNHNVFILLISSRVDTHTKDQEAVVGAISRNLAKLKDHQGSHTSKPKRTPTERVFS
nr:hypothetical protein [Tanacetum cinerariifolium]